MNANIFVSHQIQDQIQELANCGNQEILMYEKAYKHDICSFSKVENEYSFEFKTTNSFESPYRYVFKRRLKSSKSQEPIILITADFLDNELKIYETRKSDLHHYLVFMYNDRMIEFDMKDIREWMMREGPNPKCVRARNKKCQDGSFTRCTENVYYIPTSVPRLSMNYTSNENFRNTIYIKWANLSDSHDAVHSKCNNYVVTEHYIFADQIRVETQTPQDVSISPYF